ncbi:MAG TPA: DUF417 family protein [Microvirga sp.]|nr:DUF417 family protein [Microvirga sp.]
MKAAARTRSIAADLEHLDSLAANALRWSLVLIFLWFGGMKFTSYEAQGIAPFTSASPFLGWLHAQLGVHGSSVAIGILELTTCLALAAGALSPTLSLLGSLMSMTTFGLTLTFMLTTAGVAEPSAGGFPALSAMPGQFLLKDVVLLAASFALLVHSLRMVMEDASTFGRPKREPMRAASSRVG